MENLKLKEDEATKVKEQPEASGTKSATSPRTGTQKLMPLEINLDASDLMRLPSTNANQQTIQPITAHTQNDPQALQNAMTIPETPLFVQFEQSLEKPKWHQNRLVLFLVALTVGGSLAYLFLPLLGELRSANEALNQLASMDQGILEPLNPAAKLPAPPENATSSENSVNQKPPSLIPGASLIPGTEQAQTAAVQPSTTESPKILEPSKEVPPPAQVSPVAASANPAEGATVQAYFSQNPYWQLPNPRPYYKPGAAWSEDSQRALNAGMQHRFSYQHLNAVSSARKNRYLGSEGILRNALLNKKFWTRMEAGLALTEQGLPLALSDFAALTRDTRSDLVKNYMKRWSSKMTASELYMLRGMMRFMNEASRVEGLKLISKHESNSALKSLYLGAGLLDPSRTVSSIAANEAKKYSLDSEQLLALHKEETFKTWNNSFPDEVTNSERADVEVVLSDVIQAQLETPSDIVPSLENSKLDENLDRSEFQESVKLIRKSVEVQTNKDDGFDSLRATIKQVD